MKFKSYSTNKEKSPKILHKKLVSYTEMTSFFYSEITSSIFLSKAFNFTLPPIGNVMIGVV